SRGVAIQMRFFYGGRQGRSGKNIKCKGNSMNEIKDSTWQNFTALLILLEGTNAAIERPELCKRVLRSEFWLQPFGGIEGLNNGLLADKQESTGYSDMKIPKSITELMGFIGNQLCKDRLDDAEVQKFFDICSRARNDCRSIVIERAWPED
ncbi:MAG: hypothetical protein ACREGC_01740, partial [Minisyncoccia bacterium]